MDCCATSPHKHLPKAVTADLSHWSPSKGTRVRRSYNQWEVTKSHEAPVRAARERRTVRVEQRALARTPSSETGRLSETIAECLTCEPAALHERDSNNALTKLWLCRALCLLLWQS